MGVRCSSFSCRSCYSAVCFGRLSEGHDVEVAFEDVPALGGGESASCSSPTEVVPKSGGSQVIYFVPLSYHVVAYNVDDLLWVDIIFVEGFFCRFLCRQFCKPHIGGDTI